MEVEYRDAVGHPGYRVGGDGSVQSCRKKGRHGGTTTWHAIKQCKCPRSGYKFIGYRVNHKRRRVAVHILVATAFIGPKPNGCEVRHIDGSKDNNRADNLAWGTHKKNMEDMVGHGRAGRSKAMRVLSDSEVLEVFRSNMAIAEITEKYGIKKSAINAIKSGRTWREITGSTRIDRRTKPCKEPA